MIQSNQPLYQQLHSIGSEGLKLFGYEPMRELPEEHDTTETGYQCIPEIAKCSGETIDTIDLKNVVLDSPYNCENHSKIFNGIDFKGGLYSYHKLIDLLICFNFI